tara:strand:+ start:666 stop:1172 length:507 start_codon:yes stop_codon:yes gene_type:complete
MAKLDFDFDYDATPNESAFEVYPAGEYTGVIVASDFKETKKRNGFFLELEIMIVDGPLAGKKIWDRLNLKHENPVAMDISKKSYKALKDATGIGRTEVEDSTDFHDKPFRMKLTQSPRKDTGEMQNNIRYLSGDTSGNPMPPAVATATAATATPQAAPAASKKKPWEK